MANKQLSSRNARRTDLGGAFVAESDVIFDSQRIGSVVADDFDNIDTELDDTAWFDKELTSQWREGATYRDWFQHERKFTATNFNRRQSRITNVGRGLMIAGTLIFALLLLSV